MRSFPVWQKPFPDSLNLGWTEDREESAALTADNLPLENVFGFSENLGTLAAGRSGYRFVGVGNDSSEQSKEAVPEDFFLPLIAMCFIL